MGALATTPPAEDRPARARPPGRAQQAEPDLRQVKANPATFAPTWAARLTP